MKNKKKVVDQALREFVDEHPEGWDHAEWIGFLGSLSERGLDVDDPAPIGLALERIRLASVLNKSNVKGLGPRRIEAIVDHFGTLWNCRGARAEDFAAISTIPAGVAGALEKALRE